MEHLMVIQTPSPHPLRIHGNEMRELSRVLAKLSNFYGVRGKDLSAGSAISLDLGVVSAIPGTPEDSSIHGIRVLSIVKLFLLVCLPKQAIIMRVVVPPSIRYWGVIKPQSGGHIPWGSCRSGGSCRGFSDVTHLIIEIPKSVDNVLDLSLNLHSMLLKHLLQIS